MTPSGSPGPPLLTFERVTKMRARGRGVEPLLDGVSFAIAAGEVVDVRGPKRSGKTALLRIAAGIDLPDDGTVRWRPSTTKGLPRRERTDRLREVAFVAQPSDWRGATGQPMLDHVALPLILAGRPVHEALATARALAEEVEAGAYVDAPPHLLPADVLMRLSLARALAREPRLLIVDAPGDGASDIEQQALQRDLLARARARRGLALLVASREASALRDADRTLLLDGSGGLHEPGRCNAGMPPFPIRAPTS